MKKKKITNNTAGRIDIALLISVLLLAAFGTVMVFSAGGAYAYARYKDEYYFLKRQIILITNILLCTYQI